MSSQVFGIVGLGRIGTAVALRAKAFGFDVVFFDPYRSNGSELAIGVRRAPSLEALLAEADVLSLHTPHTPETAGMIDAAALALLPRSRGERRLFALVGVTAGVCEEWLYRGFFLAVVAALAPGLPAVALVLVAGVAFGLAHAYQGLAGVLTTGVFGALLAGVYLSTGSLLLPVLLHAAIDLRFLLVPSSAVPSASVVPVR